MTQNNQHYLHQVNASKTPESKEYKQFKKRIMITIIFWIILIITGIFTLNSESFLNQISNNELGWILIGTGGLSIVFLVLISISQANNEGKDPIILDFSDLLDYFIKKDFSNDRYFIPFIIISIGFTLITFILSLSYFYFKL